MEAYEGKEAYIFISYAHKDSDRVMRFVAELKKYCNVWYDSGIHAGNEWADKIADKLSGCALFLFFISENSLASDNCRDELAMARDSGKPFINIRLSDIAFSGGMQLRYGRYQYFDLFAYSDYEIAAKELLKSESFSSLPSKHNVLKNLIAHTKAMMANTEEMSPNINSDNADFFVKFRIQDSPVEFGRYFGSPIVWEIKKIHRDRAYLVSKEILEVMAFDHGRSSYRESEIRSWLNTAFLESAFDEEEKKLLCSSVSEEEGCTSDQVSLLSKGQLMTFFPSNEDRIKSGTPHTGSSGLLTNASGGGWWWLSSSEPSSPDCVHRIYSNGRLGFDDDFDNTGIGVVPMIAIKID